MKTLSKIVVLLWSCLSCLALSIAIPDIPAPEPTVVEAVAIAQKQVKNDPKFVLVGVPWCLPASFHPPVDDGTQYSTDDDVNSYSWFMTSIYKDERLQKAFEQAGSAWKDKKYNSVLIIRVKKDGSVGGLTGVS